MNRRGFLGALAGATAMLLSLPKLFRREREIPLQITRSYGAAMIEDGGYEANTITWSEPADVDVRSWDGWVEWRWNGETKRWEGWTA